MLNQPKFKPGFRVEVVEPETVFLLSERDSVLLSGRLYTLVAPLLDGSHSTEDIVDLLQAQASPIEVYHALMRMEQQGYLVEKDDPLPPSLAVFCDTLKIDRNDAYSRLQGTKVAVKSCGSLTSSYFTSILESMQVQLSDEADIEVVLTEDYLQPELEAFNRAALQLSRPWMPVKPAGTVLWLGPIFVPGKTACWECLAQRLRDNRPVAGFVERHKQIKSPLISPSSQLPATMHMALDLAAMELLKWILAGENPRLENSLITYDTFSLKTQNHVLVKRPQCPSCGETPVIRQPQPLILASCPKTFTADGGHRHVSPEDTLKKYRHHISPITGVVRELSRLYTGEVDLTKTYVAKHNFVTLFDDLYGLRKNLGGRSSGKGRTDSQAMASGFGEAIERYSGIFEGYEIREAASYKQLGDLAIHPNACMNYSEAQYENREAWNASCGGWFQKVPAPFDEAKVLDWTPVWSFSHQKFKYLPTAYCYYGYFNSDQPDCWADSSGCAAGNTIEEAILQGFMEIVERDCVALWWYNRVKRPRVDLDSFDDPYFQTITDYYHELHRDVWVVDITNDLEIPAFAALSRRTDRPVEDITFGFGAHFDPKIALLRAVTESNQMLPMVLPSRPDGTTIYPQVLDPLAIQWWQTATVENQFYLAPDDRVPAKVRSDYPQRWSQDLRDDVITCQQTVEKLGLEMLVLDQTRPDIGMNVAKVIVPGMRHFWKRLGPGRLYDVPVKLGWFSEPLLEDQFNPFPMWL